MAWTPEEVDPGPLGDPVARAAELAATGGPVAGVEFRLLIETVEQLYLRAKAQGKATVTAFVDASLPMFDSLEALPGLTPRQTAEIHHHRGKVYRWLHRDEDARREFETVMTGPFPPAKTKFAFDGSISKPSRDSSRVILSRSSITMERLRWKCSSSPKAAIAPAWAGRPSG
jgi:hypothetical protein